MQQADLVNLRRAAAYSYVGDVESNAFAANWLLEDAIEQFISFVNSSFFDGSAKIVDKRNDSVLIQGQLCNSSLADMFEKVESTKSKYNVSEYACYQTSLEQILHSFASQQDDYNVDK